MRNAAQGLDIAEPSQASGQETADAEEIAGIYTRLLAHGFQEVHVKKALQAQTLTLFLLHHTQTFQLDAATTHCGSHNMPMFRLHLAWPAF